jgi:hypothetical protein
MSTASASTSRIVDLGREDELVTWQEWLGRAMSTMQESVEENQRDRLVFRVTLRDGRAFVAKHVLTHISRGMCSIVPDRWVEDEKATHVNGSPVCEVITGYMFLGTGDDALPTALCVPPVEIASVECVLPTVLDEPEPFGFAAAAQMRVRDKPSLEQVEEPSRIGARNQGAD